MSFRERWEKSSIADIAGVVSALGAIAAVIVLICEINQEREYKERDLRAYLNVLPPIVTFDTSGNIYAEFSIQNSGKTPAYDVQDSMRFEIVYKGDIQTVVDPRNYPVNEVKHVIGPGVSFVLPMTPREGTSQSFRGVDTDKYRLFFWGRTTYTDVYGQAHWITYAYHYMWRHGNMFWHTQHNDADQNYKIK